MGHHISGVVIRGEVLVDLLVDYGTAAVTLAPDLTLVWMDIHYTEYWARRLQILGRLARPPSVTDPMLMPDDAVIAELARLMCTESPLRYAVVWTDYFAGRGDQRAVAYVGTEPVDTDGTINGALRALGVVAEPGLDEFDTVGLSDHRSIPDELMDLWESYPD